MIQVETVEINGRQFTRTWSDAELFIVNAVDGTGPYEEALDLPEFGRTYVETNIAIDSNTDDEDESEAYEQAGRILMGVEDE